MASEPFRNQRYKDLKKQLIKEGKLFTDPEFPPNASSIFFDSTRADDIEWKRAGEMQPNPKLFVDGIDSDNVKQGELGNCWFVSACSTLTHNPVMLNKVIPNGSEQEWHNNQAERYSGIFHFCFWRFGRWVDVVVDDLLPTRGGQLIFAHSKTSNEFWSALLEKAFAKLHGCYESLRGGTLGEAFVHFTGGVLESIDLDKETVQNDETKRLELFTKLQGAFDDHALIAAGVAFRTADDIEKQMECGLVKGHLYAITAIKRLPLDANYGGLLSTLFSNPEKVLMVRFQNPWGAKEWNGAWSDGAPEWQRISENQKHELGLKVEEDNQFWMNWEDVCKNFTVISVCYQIQPDTEPKLTHRELMKMYDRSASDFDRTDPSTTAATTISTAATDDEWEVVEEMDFPRLQKLTLPNVADGDDIPNERYGTLEFYDKAYDWVVPFNSKPLQRTHRFFYTITTTDDPVIEKLATNSEFTVFGTDSLIATLMCSTMSVYSWDIIVHRVGNKVFFDRRPHADIEYLTVSETAIEPPQDEGNSLNSPKNLAMEALFINRNFSQQVLKMGDEKHAFENPNIPFADQSVDPSNNASVGYRYRKWDLGNGVSLVCRCEQDGVTVGQNNEIQYLTVKAFNEWDSRYSDGAVLATESKNNSCKLAKWTVQAILTGSDYLKFGYVSRVHNRDSTKHVILATQQFKPVEFANQINLNMDNAWGILRCIIDLCMKQPKGKYLLMKDPNKAVLRMYKLPAGSFSSESEDDGDDEDDVGGPDNDEHPQSK